jgi:hypothetical protein
VVERIEFPRPGNDFWNYYNWGEPLLLKGYRQDSVGAGWCDTCDFKCADGNEPPYHYNSCPFYLGAGTYLSSPTGYLWPMKERWYPYAPNAHRRELRERKAQKKELGKARGQARARAYSKERTRMRKKEKRGVSTQLRTQSYSPHQYKYRGEYQYYDDADYADDYAESE